MVGVGRGGFLGFGGVLLMPLFFPVTMISKRLRFDKTADVDEAFGIIENKVAILKERDLPSRTPRKLPQRLTPEELDALEEAINQGPAQPTFP